MQWVGVSDVELTRDADLCVWTVANVSCQRVRVRVCARSTLWSLRMEQPQSMNTQRTPSWQHEETFPAQLKPVCDALSSPAQSSPVNPALQRVQFHKSLARRTQIEIERGCEWRGWVKRPPSMLSDAICSTHTIHADSEAGRISYYIVIEVGKCSQNNTFPSTTHFPCLGPLGSTSRKALFGRYRCKVGRVYLKKLLKQID